MQHVGIKISFDLDNASVYQHITDSDGSESYVNGAAALEILRDMLMGANVAADVDGSSVTLTISK